MLVGDLLPNAAARSTPRAASASAAASACDLRGTVSGPKVPSSPRRYGLSDQNGFPGEDTFANADAAGLGITRVRLVIPFDLMTQAGRVRAGNFHCDDFQNVYDWIVRQVQAQREVLISFERARNKFGADVAPTVAVYRDAVRAFLDKFPVVKLYTAWNEPNYTAQPVRNPARAGQFWRALNGLCVSTTANRGCKVGAGDFSDVVSADGTRGLVASYLNDYYAAMGARRPAFWAVHAYQAIVRSRYARLQRFFDWGPVKRTGAVWITEAGAYRYRRTPATVPESDGAAQLKAFFDSDVYTHNLSNIKRFYYFEWHGDGPGSEDTGLVRSPKEAGAASDARSAAP